VVDAGGSKRTPEIKNTRKRTPEKERQKNK